MGNSISRRRAAGIRQGQIRAKALPASTMHDAPRFVADVMLGRLAKWLRIAGFDVLYSNRYTDDELDRLSRVENRILLSRDTRLLVRRSVRNFIFLESETIEEQILQILGSTRTVQLPGLLSRCLKCNTPLVGATRESVRDQVPEFVFETQRQFKSCPTCRKIYWAGTHRQAVLQTLRRLAKGQSRVSPSEE